MKAPFSPYLSARADEFKALVRALEARYDYVSLLATDSIGWRVSISQHQKAVAEETMTTERGCVARVYRDGLYSEAAFNEFDPAGPEATARRLTDVLDHQLSVLRDADVEPYETGRLADEPERVFVEMETDRLPEEEDMAALIERLTAISDDGMAKGAERMPDAQMLDCRASAQSTHVCKLFITENRDLRQSYVYSEGAISAEVTREGRNEMSYEGVSGRCGPELFDRLDAQLDKVLNTARELLSAERPVPGEYDIIAAPDIAGLIAHEAFGHGVEMDMFVKARALGAAYLDKRVGSDRVTMHEGALCAVDVTSYAFDDEGTPAGDVIEIDRGILKTGICDALSALRLGVKPTGNGKRENYEHKVYTRMTNTVFDSGNDKLEDMIASIDKGYLLEGVMSGMEDPKHWGIQCIVERGYEISGGKLTGKVIAPVVMTGYVPDLLGSVSMVSDDRGVFGTGGCGKGHKEWVKVADGGPYLKARARLG